MKKHLLLIAFLTLFTAWSYAQNASLVRNTEAPKAAIKWANETHDFGKIERGKPVTTTFNFTNIGDAPLVLTHVQGSCGCTATDYTKEALAPGKSGYVKATYNAASPGAFTKTVTVTTSTGETKQLTIKGEVVEKN